MILPYASFFFGIESASPCAVALIGGAIIVPYASFVCIESVSSCVVAGTLVSHPKMFLFLYLIITIVLAKIIIPSKQKSGIVIPREIISAIASLFKEESLLSEIVVILVPSSTLMVGLIVMAELTVFMAELAVVKTELAVITVSKAGVIAMVGSGFSDV